MTDWPSEARHYTAAPSPTWAPCASGSLPEAHFFPCLFWRDAMEAGQRVPSACFPFSPGAWTSRGPRPHCSPISFRLPITEGPPYCQKEELDRRVTNNFKGTASVDAKWGDWGDADVSTEQRYWPEPRRYGHDITVLLLGHLPCPLLATCQSQGWGDAIPGK